MSIKSQGGVFGRNPTFNDVTVEGDLSIDGTLTIGGSVITGLNLQGNWDSSTNTPDLTALTPDAGKFWIVSVAGSTNLGGITNWTVGDWALYDGSAWQRVEGGTVDLSTGVTGILAITNGGTGASTASTARSNLGAGAVGDNLFTAATASAAQQAMDVEVGVDVQAYDATILKSADIGSTVQGYDADTAKLDQAANFTAGLQAGGSDVLVDTDIGSTVQAYDADTAKYDDTTANFTGTLQNGGSNVLVDTDIGSTVEAYDSTILKSADIGSTVQGYDADTAKYDDTTANFTGTLQNGGSNVVVDSDIGSTVQAYNANILTSSDIGSTVQAYDADTAKLDVSQIFTAGQTFPNGLKVNNSGSYNLTLGNDYINTVNAAQNPLRFTRSGTTRMELSHYGNLTLNTGNLVIGTSGKGIDFSATSGTGTSELLDDYEEGEYTPTFTPNTSGSIGTNSVDTRNKFTYTKIGRLVVINGGIQFASVSSPVGTYVEISLPFSIISGVGTTGSAAETVTYGGSQYTITANTGFSVLRWAIDASTITNSTFLYVTIPYLAA